MNTSRVRVCALILVGFSSVLFSEDNRAHESRPRRPVEAQSRSNPVGYLKGRWEDGAFQYLDDKNNWVTAKAAYRTSKEGTFLDINGNTVEYSKGDVLFKAADDGWYKARKEIPRTKEKADPAVPNPSGIKLSKFEELVIKYTNEERMKHGLPPLKVAPQLLKLSQQKSVNMARQRLMSHEVFPIPKGGENIARGQPSAKEVVRTWMNSKGHRANILNRHWSTIGVGMAQGAGGPYWTQNFQ